MLARIGWAIAAFWMARFLLLGAPGILFDPMAGVRFTPFGLGSLSPAPPPRTGGMPT